MQQAKKNTGEARRQPLMNIDEVAATLGVTVRHVRRLVAERRIPCVKWGHLLRFDPDELASWVDRARHADEGGWQTARNS
jgi:excisionase family DNA binding protein